MKYASWQQQLLRAAVRRTIGTAAARASLLTAPSAFPTRQMYQKHTRPVASGIRLCARARCWWTLKVWLAAGTAFDRSVWWVCHHTPKRMLSRIRCNISAVSQLQKASDPPRRRPEGPSLFQALASPPSPPQKLGPTTAVLLACWAHEIICWISNIVFNLGSPHPGPRFASATATPAVEWPAQTHRS